MRLLSLFLLCAAAPAAADTLTAPGQVSAVTLYPQGATVTRTVSFTAPAGQHEVIVPGLPGDTAPEGLRIRAPEGVTVGAVSLASGRQPPAPDVASPAVVAARAEVERLQRALEEKQRAVAQIGARAEAARARAVFLQSLAAEQARAGALPAPDALRAVAELVGDEVLAAREAELRAQVDTAAANRALQPDFEALARAQAALAALTAPPPDDAPALVLTLHVATAGEVALEVDALAQSAGWQPVYDLRLTRGPDALAVARGVTVAQDTGEDWRGIALTLSTARPSEQSAPTVLYPWLRQIAPEPRPGMDFRAGGGMPMPAPAAPAMEAAVADAVGGFDTGLQGTVFTYRFTAPVDIRSGVDDLRLSMDEQPVEVAVRAEGVPLLDATAYLVAELVNTTGQPLLPGQATLYAEGALVGGAWLPLIPAQGEATVGFGAIDGLRLTRTVPDRRTGEEGILTTSNRSEETAVIEVENLTGESWPVRILDRVPYSEQDDLQISWEADPAPTGTDPEGRRGLLVWDLDLPPGQTRTLRVQSRLAWPRGMVLQ